jgi:surface antigen
MNTGSIAGIVRKDSVSGLVVSGVVVNCGGKSALTDYNGKFRIEGINIGNQTISFSKSGYEPYQKTVSIIAGKTANIGDRWLTKKSSSNTTSSVLNAVKCPSGNGLYCGDSGKGQNASYLYQCINGSYSLITTCSNGCQQNGAGKNDSCKTSSGDSPLVTSQYPYGNARIANCTATCYPDEWGFCKKNCTSYIAWKINSTGGSNSFTNRMNGGKWGNAYNWDDNASRLGITVNNTPSVGAIAQWNEKEVAGGLGHVAYVEKVNSDGTVNVSEYNFSNKCGYGERSNKRAPRYIHINPSNSVSVGSVSGKVYKNSISSKVALSDVKVECGGKSGKTNSDGEFKIKDVPAGNQTIKFSKDGYQTYSREVQIKAGYSAKLEDRWLVEKSSKKEAVVIFIDGMCRDATFNGDIKSCGSYLENELINELKGFTPSTCKWSRDLKDTIIPDIFTPDKKKEYQHVEECVRIMNALATKRNTNTIIVSHSWGSVLAYRVLKNNPNMKIKLKN